MATAVIKKKGAQLTLQVDTKGKDPAGWEVKLNEKQNSGVDAVFKLPVTKVGQWDPHWKTAVQFLFVKFVKINK